MYNNYKIIGMEKELIINSGWQLCPKCYGDGNLLRYNSPTLVSSTPICDLCNGEKIINLGTGLPPSQELIGDQIRLKCRSMSHNGEVKLPNI